MLWTVELWSCKVCISSRVFSFPRGKFITQVASLGVIFGTPPPLWQLRDVLISNSSDRKVSRFALIHPHFLLRPYSGQELIIQATGKMVFLYNTFINPYGNLNHSFALTRTTERLAVESVCICCRSGSCLAGCGQWHSPVRPEHGSLAPAGE